MRRFLVILVLAVIATAATVRARADGTPEKTAAMAERLTIVDLTDSTPFNSLEPGELVRVVGATPSGGKISISIDGPGRLVWQIVVKTVKDGKLQIGEFKEEFVIRRAILGHGPVKATVTCTPPTGEPNTKVYEFEWK